MGARIEKDGKFYRMRRGVLVEIPPEWLGRTVSRQTILKRPSKGLHKHSKLGKHPASAKTRGKSPEDNTEALEDS